jgi:hypothetical protein
MTVAIWPSELPRPLRAGYQRQTDDPRLARRAGAGPPDYRRRWSGVSRGVSMVISVTRSQKAVFDTFHDEVVAMGSLPFRMPDPTTDGWPMLDDTGRPVLAGDGAPLLLAAEWLCLFGATMPVETIVNVRFQISFTVKVLP